MQENIIRNHTSHSIAQYSRSSQYLVHMREQPVLTALSGRLAHQILRLAGDLLEQRTLGALSKYAVPSGGAGGTAAVLPLHRAVILLLRNRPRGCLTLKLRRFVMIGGGDRAYLPRQKGPASGAEAGGSRQDVAYTRLTLQTWSGGWHLEKYAQ